MKYIFGFNTTLAAHLHLYVEELYVLSWFLQFIESGQMVESPDFPEYYLVTARKVQEDCPGLRHNSIRNIGTILDRLSGIAVDSDRRFGYPLAKLLVDLKYRNTYFKVNKPVVHQLKARAPMRTEESLLSPDFDEEFYDQYKQISAIYDFKHDIRKKPHVLLSAQWHVRCILDGSFIDRQEWDSTWLAKQDLALLKKPSFDLILRAVQKYAEGTQEGGWLANRSNKCSLATFFYNPRTQKSMFLHLISDHRMNDISDEEREEFTVEARKLYTQLNLDGDKMNTYLFGVYKYWKDNFVSLRKAHSTSQRIVWDRFFGEQPNWRRFCKYYLEYLKGLSSVTDWDIGVNSKRWYGFARYIYTNYNRLKIINASSFYDKLESRGGDNEGDM